MCSSLCVCSAFVVSNFAQVFSNRLGIETGWNCHISLKPRESTASRTDSVYTPSAASPPLMRTDALNSVEVDCDVARGVVSATFNQGAEAQSHDRASYQHHRRSTSAQPSLDSAEVDFNETVSQIVS